MSAIRAIVGRTASAMRVRIYPERSRRPDTHFAYLKDPIAGSRRQDPYRSGRRRTIAVQPAGNRDNNHLRKPVAPRGEPSRSGRFRPTSAAGLPDLSAQRPYRICRQATRIDLVGPLIKQPGHEPGRPEASRSRLIAGYPPCPVLPASSNVTRWSLDRGGGIAGDQPRVLPSVLRASTVAA